MAGNERRIRVFVSSTFHDMGGERDELMSQTWPELRRLCREKRVEFVEVDLRWGITEAQSTRNETLKLCLDEIEACRPFFIGLLGERYGWTPGEQVFSDDLCQEQLWLRDLRGKGRSITEIEVLHGVLNDPESARYAHFYFRDRSYSLERGPEFEAESTADGEKQSALKSAIRTACAKHRIRLCEDYSDPRQLAAKVLSDFTALVETRFPETGAFNAIAQQSADHEAYSEALTQVYVQPGRSFDLLDQHAQSESGPLVIVGESGSGKSALLANWARSWSRRHPADLIIEHYTGAAAESTDESGLMRRVMYEIKRWCGDPAPLPDSRTDLDNDFGGWLIKGREKADREGARLILLLDAVEQFEDARARSLSWLPRDLFQGRLRLIVATLPRTDDSESLPHQLWTELPMPVLDVQERRQLVSSYLARFGKALSHERLDRLSAAPASSSPFYLTTLLDDLRVTGTHSRLDERIAAYLSAPDSSSLVGHVLRRYERDYERDRPALVAEALGLLFASRRGLSENELLELLRPSDRNQLPTAIWAPLRAALSDALIDRGGILGFRHDILRLGVSAAFVPDLDRRDELQLRLADYFEAQPASARSSGELAWLLNETESFARLRTCLLDIERFLFLQQENVQALRRYWIALGEDRSMGTDYVESFGKWLSKGPTDERIGVAATELGLYLLDAALYKEAEQILREALIANERSLGPEHQTVAVNLNNLVLVLLATNRLVEAELAQRRALEIMQREPEDPTTAACLSTLAAILRETNRPAEAEALLKRALRINEEAFGRNHVRVAHTLANIAQLMKETGRPHSAESMMRAALTMNEAGYGVDHPEVATLLNNLGGLLAVLRRPDEAEPLYRRALAIDEKNYGADHPKVARDLNGLGTLLSSTKRFADAEPLFHRAAAITEQISGPWSPELAPPLTNLAILLGRTSRIRESQQMFRRVLEILLRFSRISGHMHPRVKPTAEYYEEASRLLGRSSDEIAATMAEIAPEL